MYISRIPAFPVDALLAAGRRARPDRRISGALRLRDGELTVVALDPTA